MAEKGPAQNLERVCVCVCVCVRSMAEKGPSSKPGEGVCVCVCVGGVCKEHGRERAQL